MDALIYELEKSEKINEIQEELKKQKGSIVISGLIDVAKIQLIATLFKNSNKSIVFLTYNELQAKKLYQDLKAFGIKPLLFPKREIVAYDYDVQSMEILHKRMEVLEKIYLAEKNNEKIVVITTIEAVMQKMISKNELYKNIIEFEVGKTFDTEEVKQRLIKLGYERIDLIEGKGQFSIRGGIVDVGLSDKIGVRIEFWGDEVDSIRFFKISSQRSTEMIKEITIFPAHEMIIDDLKSAYNKIKENHENQSEDLEIIKNGDYTSKIDKYFNLFYKESQYFLDQVFEKYEWILDEKNKINQRKNNIIVDNNKLIDSLIEKEKFVPEAIENISKFEYNFEKKPIIYLEQNDIQKNITKYYFETREINIYSLEPESLITDLNKYKNEKKKIIILGGNELNSNKICEILKENEINYKFDKTLENIKEGEIVVTLGALSSGFENYDLNLVVISLSNIFDQPVKRRKKVSNTFKEGEKIVFADLEVGDFVVHQTHGIGQFIGVNTITADGVTKDYIKLKYKNDDILYVPTNNLDSVRKYIGGGEAQPNLNKLGGKEWSQTTQKVKKNLQEVAKDLIELYAKRQKINGFSFSPDTPWQKQFEDSFPYTETDDQLRCIEEVKKDMEKPIPMDRLLCGDVGYGKTEVAIRAAFKAVMDQKQVAYLVPTTILANQQFIEFKKRMSEFAMKVEVLNRFRKPKEQTEIIRKLKLGEVDVVIGTHRLLSKDIEFKNLGLLIIDEEHKFGVKAKEKIKQLKTSVDVLTMTATPIPRTLHMSIVGVRDMSVIYDPPHNRKPVQTYVLEYDEEIISEAITKEIEREGQVFYLYNNVEGIEKKAREISQMVPEAKVDFAHGKMTGAQLEDIMQSFINKEINVLVCTTILESGIDIPNANTIVVENADRLGLAQLYQIRGRVGRADKQAYAYITYKRDKLLSEVADKRLKAIKEFTEFGSGFKIAMRDLEIRGAGSMLGEVQHGHMEQVGYDTYCKLLDEVIKEMNGIEITEDRDIQIDLSISSFIPDTFIENSSQKIEIYQNIALCKTEEDIQNVVDEVIDRYGKIPYQLNNLLEIARIKELAKKYNVTKVVQKNNKILFYMINEIVTPELVTRLIKKYTTKIRFSNAIEPYVTYDLKNKNDKSIITEVKEFLNTVGGKD